MPSTFDKNEALERTAGREKCIEACNKAIEDSQNLANTLHPLYVATDWKWGCGRDLQVPTVQEIQAALVKLLESAKKNIRKADRPGQAGISSGGIEIAVDGGGFLRVSFRYDTCYAVEEVDDL